MFVQRHFSILCDQGSLLCVFHFQGTSLDTFVLTKPDFSSFIFISSVCCSEIIVLNLRARL